MADKIITIDELLKTLDGYSHKELHLHHTWKPAHKSFNGSNGLQLQASMREYHVETWGWSDIGQHVTLLPDGTFVTGRSFARNPGSITDYNTGAFACEMVGNFDTPGTGAENSQGYDAFEGKQKTSALRLAKYFNDKGRYVRFHRENAAKTCPGTSIDKAKFMEEVRALAEIKDVNAAIDAWSKVGIIGAAADMKKEFAAGKLTPSRLEAFLIKSAKYIAGKGLV